VNCSLLEEVAFGMVQLAADIPRYIPHGLGCFNDALTQTIKASIAMEPEELQCANDG
jgi:hypothetical protein